MTPEEILKDLTGNRELNNEEFIRDPISILAFAMLLNASDIYLVPGSPIRMRVKGKILDITHEKLKAKETEDIITKLLPNELLDRLANQKSVDWSCGVVISESDINYFNEYMLADVHLTESEISKGARFRVNTFFQRGTFATVMRRIPYKIPTLEELNLPPDLKELIDYNGGLVLFAGKVGTGKSTSLAALIELINKTKKKNIITIEDPIEYLYVSKESTISQRELYQDVRSFAEGLRDALRESPDVVLVGEMRDLDTMSQALVIAETGHLVFSTVHSSTAPGAIERIANVFPEREKRMVLHRLANNLKAVICQQLVPTVDGDLIPAVEILKVTPGISDLIKRADRENVIPQITSAMEVSQSEGMITMEFYLMKLVQEGKIDPKTALARSFRYEAMKNLLTNRGYLG